MTVAVGLVYDAKARFRSRALVRVGAPVDVTQWVEAYRRDERATVHDVTEDLALQLDRVSPSFSSWAQAKQMSWIAELVVRRPGEEPVGDLGWATRSMWRRAWRPDRTHAPKRWESCFRTLRSTSGTSSCWV